MPWDSWQCGSPSGQPSSQMRYRRMFMHKRLRGFLAGCAVAAVSTPGLALAQAPAPAPTAVPAAGAVSTVVANPTYVFIPMEIDVNRSAAEVWKRVGKYCDIGEWLQIAAGCKI